MTELISSGKPDTDIPVPDALDFEYTIQVPFLKKKCIKYPSKLPEAVGFLK